MRREHILLLVPALSLVVLGWWFCRVREPSHTSRIQHQLSATGSVQNAPAAGLQSVVGSGPVKSGPMTTDVVSSGRSDVAPGQSLDPNVSADLGAPYDVYDLAFRRWPPTDMPPGEQEEAVEIFLRERAMWERLQGLDGDVEIRAYVIENDQEKEVSSTRGQIHMEPTEPDEEAIKQKKMVSYYKVSIADPNGRWQCTSDGRVSGTQFSGSDSALPAKLLDWIRSPVIPQALSLPKVSLLDGPDDKLYAHKYFSSERALWRVSPGEGARDSFLYRHKEGENHYTTKVFEQGHFSRYQKTKNGETSARADYKNYRGDSAGEAFPTEVTLYCVYGVEKWKLKLTFSNLALDFK